MKKDLLIISMFSIDDWATAYDGKTLAVDSDRDSQELEQSLSKFFKKKTEVLFYDSDDSVKYDAKITIGDDNLNAYYANIRWAEQI